MASSEQSYQKRRLFTSYFWVVVSIFLVLLLMGLQGFFLLNAQKLADYFREQVPMSIYFTESATDVEMSQLEKTLQMADYTKSADFVSKEEGAERTRSELGEDFMKTLDGYNPLPNSIDVRLKADYVNDSGIDSIVSDLESKKYVEEVNYDRPLISMLNQNIQRITIWMLAVSGVFILIAFLLINSSIRLSIYAKRFTIKTMQMVGATKGFIRRPFIWSGVKLGLIGAIMAMVAVGVGIYYMDERFPQLGLMSDVELLGVLFGCIFIAGILITLISTWFATTRYLNLRTDQLYY